MTERGRAQAAARRERAAVQVLVGELNRAVAELAPNCARAAQQLPTLAAAAKALEAKEKRLAALQATLEEERLVLARERQAAVAQARDEGFADCWAAARQTFGARAETPNPPERLMDGVGVEPPLPDQPEAPAVARTKIWERPSRSIRQKKIVS